MTGREDGFGYQDLTEFAEKFSPIGIELKMFNGIFNRVVPQAFLTGLRRDGAALASAQLPAQPGSSAQAGVTHAQRVALEEIFGPVLSVMIPPSRDRPEAAFERANIGQSG